MSSSSIRGSHVTSNEAHQVEEEHFKTPAQYMDDYHSSSDGDEGGIDRIDDDSDDSFHSLTEELQGVSLDDSLNSGRVGSGSRGGDDENISDGTRVGVTQRAGSSEDEIAGMHSEINADVQCLANEIESKNNSAGFGNQMNNLISTCNSSSAPQVTALKHSTSTDLSSSRETNEDSDVRTNEATSGDGVVRERLEGTASSEDGHPEEGSSSGSGEAGTHPQEAAGSEHCTAGLPGTLGLEKTEEDVDEQGILDEDICCLDFVKARDEECELSVKDRDTGLTDEEIERAGTLALSLKRDGNLLFAESRYSDAIERYNAGLQQCPLSAAQDRAMLYHNRAVAYVKMEEPKLAVHSLSRALLLWPEYSKAVSRRAGLHEQLDQLDEALQDYKTLLELQPGNAEARAALQRLPPRIEERNEKLKEEMLGKLKDLGNMFLRPFGLSTSNFQMQQDPASGGYNIKFNQNPN